MLRVKLAYQANCWGPLGGHAVGVTSIGQLTYLTYGDIGRAIDEIAEVGYQGVELFDGNVLDYPGGGAALRSALDDAGLKLVGVYTGANFVFPDILDQELAKIARVADAAAALSAEHLVIGGGAKRLEGVAPGDYDRLAESLQRVAALASARGLKPHYHPHLSTLVEGPAEVDRIFSMTSIDFCPDTAHLAAAGGDGRRDGRQTLRPHLLRSSEGIAARAVRLHASGRRRSRQRARHSRAGGGRFSGLDRR